MKPGKYDKRFVIRIVGDELAVLQKLTYAMCEAFGLDRKIEAYRGIRPITLYSWDLDCLEAVTYLALQDPTADEITTESELIALKQLHQRIRQLLQSNEEVE